MSFWPSISRAEPPVDPGDGAPPELAHVSTSAALRPRSDEESLGFDARAHLRFSISRQRLLDQPLALMAASALYVLSLAIGYSTFDPRFTFVFPRETIFALVFSHLALVFWLLAVVLWMRYWVKASPGLVPRFSPAAWFGFLVIGALGFFLYGPQEVFLAGDMAHNATHTVSIASGHNLYSAWVNHSGWGKQSFMFYLLAPFFALFWPEYESLPVRLHALCNLLCIAGFYLFIRSLRVHTGIALLLSAALMAAPILYWPQNYFIPRNVTAPAFIFLNLLLLRNYLVEEDADRKRAWAALFGLSVGFSYNIYDTNYVVGALLMGAFVVRVLADFRQGWTVAEQRVRLALVSMLIGLGPLLLCQLDVDVVGSRINSGDVQNHLFTPEYMTATLGRYFTEGLSGTFPTDDIWVKVGLLCLGALLALRRGPWYFWMVFAGLALVFVAIVLPEPGQAVRRTLMLVYMAFVCLAVLFDSLYRRVGRVALLGIGVVTCWVALWGGAKTYEQVRSQVTRDEQRHQIAYERFLAAHRHVPNFYVVEPNLAPNALLRTGGRLEIFDLVSDARDGRMIWAMDNSRDPSWEEKTLRMEAHLARIARTGAPFVFCFWVDGIDWIHWAQPERTEEIRKMEARFLAALRRHGITDALRHTLGAPGYFTVRAYVREETRLPPPQVESASAPLPRF
jgi:hypothetical protein